MKRTVAQYHRGEGVKGRVEGWGGAIAINKAIIWREK